MNPTRTTHKDGTEEILDRRLDAELRESVKVTEAHLAPLIVIRNVKGQIRYTRFKIPKGFHYERVVINESSAK